MIKEILAFKKLTKQIILFVIDFFSSNFAFILSIILLEGRVKIDIYIYDHLILLISFAFFPFFVFL